MTGVLEAGPTAASLFLRGVAGNSQVGGAAIAIAAFARSRSGGTADREDMEGGRIHGYNGNVYGGFHKDTQEGMIYKWKNVIYG